MSFKMKLNLTKPLIFLDLEATGLNLGSDRIVEIGMVKVNPDNGTETKNMRINPQIPIPEKISKLHGIYDADVANCLTFKEAVPQLLHFIEQADFAGYNSNKFDMPLLAEEFLRADIDFDLSTRRLVDVQNIFHIMEPRNLVAAYKFYCDKPLINAHSALADATATYEVFKAQLLRYEHTELENEKGESYKPVLNDIQTLSTLTNVSKNADLAGRIKYNDKGQEVFAFGKHKDKTVREIFEKEPGYYTWIMKGDFPLYTKKIITKIRLSMKK